MMNRFIRLPSLLFLFLFMAFGCHQRATIPPMMIPEVIVETVLIRDVQPYMETIGTTQAFQFVEIPARVTGHLQEIRYTPGTIVAAGTPLFLIQPEQYQAEVRAAEGVLASAQAQLKLTEANLARTTLLVERNTATQEDLDTATAQRDAAAAMVIQAEAGLEKAQLNLAYTDVRSPITGKVDRNLVDIGNMVGPTGNASVLTTVAGMDPIYVYFDISDSQFNDIRRHARAVQAKEGGATEQEAYTLIGDGDQIEFEISLIRGAEPGMGEFPYKGVIDMAANRIDPSTGTITVRGKIPNADYGIFPGQICRVRIPIWKVSDAVLVRQEAIGTALNQRFVYVVDERDIAHRRVVELGLNQPDGTRVVTKGLEKGERYVVRGIQRVRDGSTVKVVEASTPAKD
jgi:RND family efflux transporter MFP subunit